MAFALALAFGFAAGFAFGFGAAHILAAAIQLLARKQVQGAQTIAQRLGRRGLLRDHCGKALDLFAEIARLAEPEEDTTADVGQHAETPRRPAAKRTPAQSGGLGHLSVRVLDRGCAEGACEGSKGPSGRPGRAMQNPRNISGQVCQRGKPKPLQDNNALLN